MIIQHANLTADIATDIKGHFYMRLFNELTGEIIESQVTYVSKQDIYKLLLPFFNSYSNILISNQTINN
jgi:hypothetical protein